MCHLHRIQFLAQQLDQPPFVIEQHRCISVLRNDQYRAANSRPKHTFCILFLTHDASIKNEKTLPKKSLPPCPSTVYSLEQAII